MDDRDPQKFFMSGEGKWVMTKGVGRPPGDPDSVSPSPQASLVMCPVPASSSAPAFLCSPTRHCKNLDRRTHGGDPRKVSNISPHFQGPTLRTWVFYLTMGAMCQVRISPEGGFGDWNIFVCVSVYDGWKQFGGLELIDMGDNGLCDFIIGQRRKLR